MIKSQDLIPCSVLPANKLYRKSHYERPSLDKLERDFEIEIIDKPLHEKIKFYFVQVKISCLMWQLSDANKHTWNLPINIYKLLFMEIPLLVWDNENQAWSTT